MTFVAVRTVHDPGAAAVAEEALGASGIEVRLKRLGTNPYLGAAGVEIEVRVPIDRVDDAEVILDRLAEEAEAAALRESGADEDPEPTVPASDGTLARPTPRTLLLLLALGLGILFAISYSSSSGTCDDHPRGSHGARP